MVLRKGEKLFQGSVQEALLDQISLEVAAPDMELLTTALSDFKGLKKIQRNNDLLVLTPEIGITTSDISKHLLERKVVVSHLVQKEGSLEKQFLKLLEE